MGSPILPVRLAAGIVKEPYMLYTLHAVLSHPVCCIECAFQSNINWEKQSTNYWFAISNHIGASLATELPARMTAHIIAESAHLEQQVETSIDFVGIL